MLAAGFGGLAMHLGVLCCKLQVGVNECLGFRLYTLGLVYNVDLH